MRNLNFILTLGFTLLLGLSSQASVWTDVNTWSSTWEQKYSNWVQREWQVDFFARESLPNGQSNPYKGLKTDCADTVYSMRIIFAYEHKLPIVFHDPTGGTRPITNKMSRWDNLSENARIRSFLRYIYDTMSTHTLPDDTYPVALNKESIRAGGLMMTVAKNHHSWTLKQILPIGVPWLVFNSVAGAGSGSMLQQRQSWPNPDWVFEGNQSVNGHGGFRDWRPAEYIGAPVWNVPGFSDEQYHIPTSKWLDIAQKRLATTNESDEQKINRLLSTACVGIQSRVQVVNEALVDFLSHGEQCMDAARFENFSTPNRDQRVFDDMMSLRRAYKNMIQANNAINVSNELKSQLNKIFPYIQESSRQETLKMSAQTLTEDSICSTTYADGKTIDFAEAKRRWFAGLISNNPNDELNARWGETRGPSSRAKSCPVYDTWTPNLGQD